jgi:signal transduction histidine kinase
MPVPLKHPRVISPRRERRENAAERMTDSQRRFRELAMAALEKQQAERARLARRLHDEAAQILSGAGLQLDILKMDLEEKVPGIAPRTGEIQDMLERVVWQIRELSYELSPDIAERAGLQTALDFLVGRYRKSFPRSIRLIYDSSARVTPETAAAMERIAAEALANAVQHAQCSQIEVIVKSTRGRTALEVRDNGRGFDADVERRNGRGLGLSIIECYAAKAGLDLAIVSAGSEGSRITAVAPKIK